MKSHAVVFEKPGQVAVRQLALRSPGTADVVLDVLASGISTGTEKMLFEGTMPAFPGMGYPLVPGYESIGVVVQAGPDSGRQVGTTVFVPGASCYADAAGLFGATASRLIVPGDRTYSVDESDGDDAILLALAATAHHAVKRAKRPVDLVVGHGVLGRLITRMVIALGAPAPTVWEIDATRRKGGCGYKVIDPSENGDARYQAAIDASGSTSAIDAIIARMNRQGELVLAGFYGERVGFAFAPAFMREITLSIAAEFTPADVTDVLNLVRAGRLSLSGLITHHASPADVPAAYRTAFGDPDCLKMVIDWRKAA